MNLSSVLWITLVISLGVNGLLFKLRDHAIQEGAQAIQAAQECSTGVETLKRENEKRQTALQLAFQKAQEQAKSALSKARKTEKVLPTDPGNLCASASALSAQKIQERKSQ
jgi:hypothetical protein